MVLFKKWPKHKVYSYIHCVNQFLREKRHKKWNQDCKKKKQSFMFHFCNFYDLLTSRTQKIVCWSPVFKPDFYIFSYNEQLGKIWRNFIDKFLSYHTSTLHFCFLGGFPISFEFVFFSAKRTTSLTDFPFALVHRKSKWIGKKRLCSCNKTTFSFVCW